jgi:NADPH:quinone reductase-like Zn-dependent oxidoreductase
MHALLYDPGAPHGLRLGETADPVPGPSQALVAVHAASLNFGEVAFISRRSPGDVPGWDAAGTVLEAAADGSGPPVGARVVTFGWGGAWSQRRAVDTGELAVLPGGVELAGAAALPVAGVTALRAVRRLGSMLGRRVLVTGTSGGVGGFAVQLAARAGATVVAATGRPERAVDLGAAEVARDLAGVAPVHAVLDTVGGALLAEALALLEPGGLALSIGMASLEPTTIDFEAARVRGGATIEAFGVGAGFGPDLAYLAALLAEGRLDPQVGWQGSWERVHEAIELLRGRRLNGKAVMEVES